MPGRGPGAPRELFALRGEEALTVNQHCWLELGPTDAITRAWALGRPVPTDELRRAYVLDKAALGAQLITPHLAHRHVVADRYAASDLVYYACLWGGDPTELYDAYVDAGVRFPDVTVYLDTGIEAALAKFRGKHPDHLHWYEDERTIAAMQDAFEQILFSGAFPAFANVVRIDAGEDLDGQCVRIDACVASRLAGVATVSGGGG